MPNTVPTANTAQMETPFRTTTPYTPDTTAMTAKQVHPVHVHINTSQSGPPAHCAHVHKSSKQVCRPGESLGLRGQAPTQWKDFCEQTPIDEARHFVTLFQLL